MKTKMTPFIVTRANGIEMINYYINIFNNSKVLSLEYYNDLPHGEPTDLLNGHVKLFNQEFYFMGLRDKYNPNGDYTENFLVEVCTKEEFYQYFDALKEGGTVMMGPEPFEPFMKYELCTWLKDKYGITWQFVLLNEENMLINNIHEALELAKTTSDFKTYFQTLTTLGLSYYKFDIKSGYTYFVMTDGKEIKDTVAKTVEREINIITDTESAIEIATKHTAGGDFDLLTKTLADFGIAYWKTDFVNKKVIYFDVLDNILFETNMG